MKQIMEHFWRAAEAVHRAHVAGLAAAPAGAAAPFVLSDDDRIASCEPIMPKFKLFLNAPNKKYDLTGNAAGNPAARLDLAKMIFAEANSYLLEAFQKAFAGYPDLARLLDGAEIRQFLKSKQVPDPGGAAAAQDLDVSIFPAVDVWYKATLLKGSTCEATTSTSMQSLMVLMQDFKMPYVDFDKSVVEIFANIDVARFANARAAFDHLSATIRATRSRQHAEDRDHDDQGAHSMAIKDLDDWQRLNPATPLTPAIYDSKSLAVLLTKLDAKRRLAKEGPKKDDQSSKEQRQIAAMKAEIKALKSKKSPEQAPPAAAQYLRGGGRGRGGRGRGGRGPPTGLARKDNSIPCSICGRVECDRGENCPKAHTEYLKAKKNQKVAKDKANKVQQAAAAHAAASRLADADKVFEISEEDSASEGGHYSCLFIPCAPDSFLPDRPVARDLYFTKGLSVLDTTDVPCAPPEGL